MELVAEEVAVAYFEVRHRRHDSDESPEEPIEIVGNKQLYLGRNADLCDRCWDDLDISRVHLRIHCIVYDKDPGSRVPPSVYATDLSTFGTRLKKHDRETSQNEHGFLMRKNDSFLLQNGDTLYLSDTLTLNYYEYTPATEYQLTWTQECERRAFDAHYHITGRLLGSGAFGNVLVAVHQATQRQLACKIVNLKSLYRESQPPDTKLLLPFSEHHQHSHAREAGRLPSQVIRCCREVTILKDLSHPNIIGIEKVFYSTNTLYIFEELVTGGDLFSYLENKGGRLSDIETAVIIRQILKGTEYLHNCNIVHRDLKPENILMTSLEEGGRIVITDFGNARALPQNESLDDRKTRMFSLVGTWGFAAPEINRRRSTQKSLGYSKAVDLYSIGCIAAVLLSGTLLLPSYSASRQGGFSPDTVQRVSPLWDVSALDDEFDPMWRYIGSRPKDFIKRLLVVQEDRRMTAVEALDHEWFSNKQHASEFRALYKRSIKDWKPHESTLDIIEELQEVNSQSESTSIHPVAAVDLIEEAYPVSEESENLQLRDPNARIHESSPSSDNHLSPDRVQGAEPSNVQSDDLDITCVSADIPEWFEEHQHEPQASGMYSIPDSNGDLPMRDNDMREFEDSFPVIFPPGYVRRRPSELSSVVFETPIDATSESPYVQVPQSSFQIEHPTRSQKFRGTSIQTQTSIVNETPLECGGHRTHTPEPESVLFYEAPTNIVYKRRRRQHILLPSYADMFLNSQRATARHV
ncbi:unnamed protein product [Periconia digitata]|uniref:Uncharacterized protein n=1 Tax=Periconia digitata TaxID=1303443 RepID=A0A9W4UES3_9PLEO|nr:unnamed protein product [Periconia digitata]